MRRNGATCGAAATATPSRDAQATTSQSAHGHNRSRSTGKMHGLFFHRLTAFKPALFLAQGVARRADLFWFRDDVVSRCCMARVVAFDLSLCCAAFGHCVLRGLMLIVCVRHSSRGESRAVVTTERPPLQDCRAVSRVTQNSTLHQHEYATHETPRRRPHRQPIQLGGHYSPASGARPGPSSPLAAPASARRLSPYRQARLAQLHEMADAFGFVEKGLEARTHVSSPSPHLTLLRLIAAVVTPLLDDPSPGSVRPEDRDPSLGAVSDRSRPPALRIVFARDEVGSACAVTAPIDWLCTALTTETRVLCFYVTSVSRARLLPQLSSGHLILASKNALSPQNLRDTQDAHDKRDTLTRRQNACTVYRWGRRVEIEAVGSLRGELVAIETDSCCCHQALAGRSGRNAATNQTF